MQIKDKTFLVIGGAGFIGSHVVELLIKKRAKKIIIYDNFKSGTFKNIENCLKHQNVELFKDGGDILYRDLLDEAMKDVDGVFHFAALWLTECLEFTESAFEVNIRGTFNVINAVIKNNIKKIVFSSSASVYGNQALNIKDENNTPLIPNEFYGGTKSAGEMILRSLYNQQIFRQKPFEFIGLRYMNVYGLGQRSKGEHIGVIPKLIGKIKKNEDLTIHGDGSQSYDFINVKDCAKANIKAMESESTNYFLNIGTGKSVSIKDLAKILIQIYQKDLKLNFKYNVKRPIIKNRVSSVKLAMELINFESEIDIHQGLKELANI